MTTVPRNTGNLSSNTTRFEVSVKPGVAQNRPLFSLAKIRSPANREAVV